VGVAVARVGADDGGDARKTPSKPKHAATTPSAAAKRRARGTRAG